MKVLLFCIFLRKYTFSLDIILSAYQFEKHLMSDEGFEFGGNVIVFKEVLNLCLWSECLELSINLSETFLF